jgi:hypothetical protein
MKSPIVKMICTIILSSDPLNYNINHAEKSESRRDGCAGSKRLRKSSRLLLLKGGGDPLLRIRHAIEYFLWHGSIVTQNAAMGKEVSL